MAEDEETFEIEVEAGQVTGVTRTITRTPGELARKLRDMRPIESLVLLPDNPRHGDIGAISESLARFGQQKPIVVNREGLILAGNHTYQAARALGWTEIWVTESELEGVDQPGFALADNRLSDLATYDHDALLRYLEEQPDLSGTGYSIEDLEEIRADLAAPLSFSPETDPERLDELRCRFPECGHECR